MTPESQRLIGALFFTIGILLFVAALLEWAITRHDEKQARREHDLAESKPEPVPGHWHVVEDNEPGFWRVYWSERDANGDYFAAAHYPYQSFADLTADEWNREGKKPWHICSGFKPVARQ